MTPCEQQICNGENAGAIRQEDGKLVARDAFGVKLGYYDEKLNEARP